MIEKRRAPPRRSRGRQRPSRARRSVFLRIRRSLGSLPSTPPPSHPRRLPRLQADTWAAASGWRAGATHVGRERAELHPTLFPLSLPHHTHGHTTGGWRPTPPPDCATRRVTRRARVGGGRTRGPGGWGECRQRPHVAAASLLSAHSPLLVPVSPSVSPSPSLPCTDGRMRVCDGVGRSHTRDERSWREGGSEIKQRSRPGVVTTSQPKLPTHTHRAPTLRSPVE